MCCIQRITHQLDISAIRRQSTETMVMGTMQQSAIQTKLQLLFDAAEGGEHVMIAYACRRPLENHTVQ